MMKIIIYTKNEAEELEIKSRLSEYRDNLVIEAYDDEKMFKYAVASKLPDAVILLSPIKRLKSGNAQVITANSMETISDLIERVKGELELGYEELTEEKMLEIEKIFCDNCKSKEVLEDDRVKVYLRDLIDARTRFSAEDADAAVQKIFSRIRGYGILDQLLADEEITEIMANGKDDIYIEKKGKLTKTDLYFNSVDEMTNVIERIANRAGKQVDDSTPILDAIMEDGSRVNAILQGVCLNGPSITIRKFAHKPLKMVDLLENKSITPEAAEFIKQIIASRHNVVISGGTGTGKTTFASACMDFIPKDERIITIEDTAEIRIDDDVNHVSLESRKENSLGAGGISISELIRSALRMRPDRIVVGEVRGKEAIDMLQAMNTGHDGSLTTAHANSPHDMLSRLETMVIQSNEIPLRAIRGQIASAVDIIVQVSRMKDGTRKVTEIVEVLGLDGNGEVDISTLFKIDNRTGKLVRENMLTNTWKLNIYGKPVLELHKEAI